VGEIRVGTSGWNYPSGKGTWNGLFYPKSRSKRAGTDRFDELRFYAEHFDTVEVNTTFYGQPRGGHTRVGRSYARGVRLLAEAVSEIHAPEDVSRGGAQERAGLGGCAARSARAGDAVRLRRLPRRHRAAGLGRQARRIARAVPRPLQGLTASARPPVR